MQKKLLNSNNMTKVIHVHLIFEKKDYYFGSISAIYTVLNDTQIGIKQSSLLHAGLYDGGVKITRRPLSSSPTSSVALRSNPHYPAQKKG